GPAHDPGVIADAVDGVKVPGGEQLGREVQLRVAPAEAAASAGEQQAALPRGQPAAVAELQRAQAAETQVVHLRGPQPCGGERAPLAPGPGEGAGPPVAEIAAQPAGRAHPLDRLPAEAALVGDEEFEDAGGVLVAAVAEGVAGAGVAEADVVEPRQGVAQD